MTYRALFITVAALVAMSACSSPPASDVVVEQVVPWEERPVPSCGQSDESADFAGIDRGSFVRLHQQRTDDVSPNWTPDMEYYVDQVTRVTDTVGVDGEGCPSISVEVDAGAFFWRVRDVELMEEAADDIRCGQSDFDADYRGLDVGDKVTVGEHNPWFGHENWAAEMSEFVGQEAEIQEIIGTDDAGCPGVVLDVDDGEYFWRIRDLHPVK